MNKKAIVENIMEFLRNINRRKITKRHNKHRFEMLRQCGIKHRELTKEQKQEVDKTFARFGVKYSYETHELVYSVSDRFDPLIIPEDFFRVCIDPVLNDYDHKYFLSDKNYFDVFMPSLRLPKTIVKNIRGDFYDSDFKLITKEQAKCLLKSYDWVVVKPSNDSGFGRGVELVSTNVDLIETHKKDFIVQEVLKQHPTFSKLNESSVNIVRIVTLFINGVVRPITAAMRVGGVGDFTDNVEHKDGYGMIVIGIDDAGRLKKYGFHSNGVKVTKTPGGVSFENYEVVHFAEMIEIAKREHSKYPYVRFIGWDFTVDFDGNVVVMEYNTKAPGILYYQYTNGPLFGDSTEELLNYVFTKKRKELKKR